MAKVTARNAEGQTVPVYQAQFNNYGDVESFLTSDQAGRKFWVHARDYDVSVDMDADQDAPEQGVMSSKEARLKSSRVVKKGAAPADNPVSETSPGPVDNPPAADDGVMTTDNTPTADDIAAPAAPTAGPEPTASKPTKPVAKS